MIEIDQQQSDPRSGFTRSHRRVLEMSFEGTAIGKLSQSIVVAGPSQLFSNCMLARYVTRYRHASNHLSALVADRRNEHVPPAQGSFCGGAECRKAMALTSAGPFQGIANVALGRVGPQIGPGTADQRAQAIKFQGLETRRVDVFDPAVQPYELDAISPGIADALQRVDEGGRTGDLEHRGRSRKSDQG
nr:hypothetical protein [Altererythrobacter sp. Root672]